MAWRRIRVVPVVDFELGSLSLAELEQVKRRVRAALARDEEQQVVLDCRAVQQIGAAFLGMVAELSAEARRRGSELVLVGLSDDCQEVLRTCRLEELEAVI